MHPLNLFWTNLANISWIFISTASPINKEEVVHNPMMAPIFLLKKSDIVSSILFVKMHVVLEIICNFVILDLDANPAFTII